jgi:hypothetical protein
MDTSDDNNFLPRNYLLNWIFKVYFRYFINTGSSAFPETEELSFSKFIFDTLSIQDHPHFQKPKNCHFQSLFSILYQYRIIRISRNRRIVIFKVYFRYRNKLKWFFQRFERFVLLMTSNLFTQKKSLRIV